MHWLETWYASVWIWLVESPEMNLTFNIFTITITHGYHMHNTWVSHAHHMGITCSICGFWCTPHWCACTDWILDMLLYGTDWLNHLQWIWHLTYSLSPHYTWVLHACHMPTTWVSHTQHINVICPQHGYHMNNTCMSMHHCKIPYVILISLYIFFWFLKYVVCTWEAYIFI